MLSPALLRSTLFCSVLFCSVLFYLFYSIYSILFYSILFYHASTTSYFHFWLENRNLWRGTTTECVVGWANYLDQFLRTRIAALPLHLSTRESHLACCFFLASLDSFSWLINTSLEREKVSFSVQSIERSFKY